MKIASIAYAFVAFGTSILGAVYASYAGDKVSPGVLSELMVVKNNDHFVARKYGTYHLPNVIPGTITSPADDEPTTTVPPRADL
ncbi:spermatogenesis and oogenesis-specific basic helix-loop-helix-containing protein 2 isoform X2, putative [Babesia ovis]|uniref:Spermatogenesis and oogenesis-specific basic helix-loop-helix-containing protein 2 isoform X2, putative n=1 Tax=Babesia ovis TaxID=5869 RepID=A0A9W5WTY0_BABOV|nr:spermatogenesis and oogenesis-specific basic helix-loop-helix-containing protein 2 isoform X2, putative [Babesia ovis]